MKKILKLIAVSGALVVASSCEKLDLDSYLENPNEVSVDASDPNLLLNQIQADFGDFVYEASVPGMDLTRMTAMTGGATYEQAYISQSMNAIWNRGYQDVLVNIETLLKSLDGSGLSAHRGMAKVMKAYTLLTLVDIFGDVPYSEALKAEEGNFNPKADSGKDIYTKAIAVLDDAIAELNKTQTGLPTRDIYYSNNKARWIAAANTIKLKAYLNLRLTDGANAKTQIGQLLTADLIDTDAEEFTYKYGTADVPVRSRSPLYRQYYQPTAGGADGYIGNYFLFQAYKGKGVEDPRWRYYFYRQVGSMDKALDDDPDSIPCVITPRPDHYARNMVFCAFDPGFFGRDHGNNDGIPPDGRAITAAGVYPAGGRVDTNVDNANYQVVTQQGQGANGAGIEPILMASFTDFMKAEAALVLGTTGNAKTLMLNGVTKSINRVRSFAVAKGQALPAGVEPSQADYEAKVAELYDAATTDAAKLGVIAKEYYLAAFGNGVEVYNLYRRTGMPGDMQPMRAVNGGQFYRSLIYPADFVNLNSSVAQKSSNTVKVFWDNNPDGFVK